MTAQEYKTKKAKLWKEYKSRLAELDLEFKLSDLLGLKFLTRDKYIWVYLDKSSLNRFSDILKVLQPTNTTTEIKGAAKTSPVLNTPFRIDIKNPAKYDSPSFKISWTCDQYDVTVSIPITNDKWTIPNVRPLYDNEYHYFTGTSARKLREMRVPCRIPKTREYISWYGGDKTITDLELIQDIITTLIAN